jgi:hypothetical protein
MDSFFVETVAALAKQAVFDPNFRRNSFRIGIRSLFHRHGGRKAVPPVTSKHTRLITVEDGALCFTRGRWEGERACRGNSTPKTKKRIPNRKNAFNFEVQHM